MSKIVRDIELLIKSENVERENEPLENRKKSWTKFWIVIAAITLFISIILIAILVVLLDRNDSNLSYRELCPISKTAVAPITSVSPCASGIINCSYFDLQLPCGDITCSVKYTTVIYGGSEAVRLQSNTEYFLIPYSYSAGYKEYCNGGWYYAHDAYNIPVMVFFEPTVGTTTSHSVNPRVELKEISADGSDASWSLVDGSINTIKVTQRIMHVAAKFNRVTIAQVFDKDHGFFIEVQTRNITLNAMGMYVMWTNNWNTTEKNKINLYKLANYTLGTKYTLTINATSANGTSRVHFLYEPEGELTVPFDLISGAQYNKIYFKTGTYGQESILEDSDDYHLMFLYSAKITHSN